MRKLKQTHKNLKLEECWTVWNARYNLDLSWDEWCDTVLMGPDENKAEEIDRICKDIRHRDIGIESTGELAESEWLLVLSIYAETN